MELGVVFPQNEIGADPIAIRDYAQAVEALGYTHLVIYDHVLGARPRGDWGPRYTEKDMFHEPMVLFGYLAVVTQRLELVTDILILPQRQVVLVAKQAAEVDVLSGGRLRLGVGVGWNYVEYEALGEQFHDRGLRIEEQVAVLRALWTQELVTFEGRWHRINDAGINPLPVQRPIPIWMGGGAEPVLRRVARLADGWFPPAVPRREALPELMPPDEAREAMARLFDYAREAGRDPATIGIEGSIAIANRTPDQWVELAETWRSFGATHLLVNTMRSGLASPQDHIDAIRRFKEAVDS